MEELVQVVQLDQEFHSQNIYKRSTEKNMDNLDNLDRKIK